MPFNDNYDYDYIFEYVESFETTDENIHAKLNALNTNIFNSYFHGLKEYFNTVLERNKLSSDVFIELIITFANRDFYLMSNRSQKSMSDSNEFNYDQLTNSKFLSPIPGLGLVSAQAGLEASHDGLNQLLNLILKTETQYRADEIKMDHLDNCVKLLGFANIYIVIKAGFDLAIWEDYSLRHNNDSKHLKILAQKPENQILNKIGQYRLERNLFSSKTMILAAQNNNTDYYNFLSRHANKKRKSKRLKSARLENYEIVYKLADGKEKDSVLKELMSFSDLTTYYAFMENENLPNLTDIKLYDVLVIFSEIQSLFQKINLIEKNEEENSTANFFQYGIHIQKNSLLNYIISKTHYSIKQIKEIINLFIHDEGYFNIWERPLILKGSKIYPILLPLLHPNTLRLLDYWLEKGGFDLDKRGELFEEHLKKELNFELKWKGYYSYSPDISVFRNKDDKFEEIDLILELKNVTLIAEVKCIKYPFDSRDYHNMHKRLKEGADQIKRKLHFIKENMQDFKDLKYFSKPIISAVITNYPIFSGYIINDVPIVDYSLLENYFISGSFRKGQISTNKVKINFQDVDKYSLNYYHNEDEMCGNLEDFLLHPIPIREKLDDVIKQDTQISLPEANPRITMDYFNFKNNSVI